MAQPQNGGTPNYAVLPLQFASDGPRENRFNREAQVYIRSASKAKTEVVVEERRMMTNRLQKLTGLSASLCLGFALTARRMS
jgi:hypothetical protein